MHMRVPDQTGMKGQRPTSRRLPTPSPGHLQPQELPHAAVVFGCLKVPAPRAKTPLAWNFLLRCRKVFIWSYQCLELTHCICTDSGIMYFCKKKQTYNFQKKGSWTGSCLGVQLVWLGLLTAGVTDLGGQRGITYLMWKKDLQAWFHGLNRYVDLECLLVEDLIFWLFLTCIQE